MGYRPSIYINDVFIIEFGKFYGYVDMGNLKSIKWLKDHKKLMDENDPENYVFCGGWGPEIKFTADEFREFWDLYIQDINEYDFSVDGYIDYDKPYNPEETWVFYSGFSGTFKEAVYDTDAKKTIVWS